MCSSDAFVIDKSTLLGTYNTLDVDLQLHRDPS
jgi:hypothetical protein